MLVPEAQPSPHTQNPHLPPVRLREASCPQVPLTLPPTPSGAGDFPPFCSPLPCFPAPAGLRAAAEGGGTAPELGRASPAPPGAVGAARARRAGSREPARGFGSAAGAPGAGQGGGSHRPRGLGDSAGGCSSRPRGGGGEWPGTGVAWLPLTPSPRRSVRRRAALPAGKSPKAAAKAACRRCGSRRVPPGPRGPGDLHRRVPPALCGGFCRRSAALG